MRLIGLGALGVAAVGLAGCESHGDRGPIGAPLPYPGQSASAVIRDARGLEVGHAMASDVQGGLRVTIVAQDLPPGMHGVHIHTVGRCDPPDFASAGGHWNPLGAHHGSMNAAGPHQGDLPNLVIASDGRATLGVNIPGATMAGLLDADGAAVVIHAGPDDLMSDPAGNSGARIACGVFAPN
ncbi:superoxide dismutase family protein [Sphingomonas koreensis]|nr:superoxide dismutase family protein [Sphingomonas koreensis]